MATTRRLNVRFLGVLVGTLAVLGPSVYFVNAYQVQRNSDAFKRRAHQAFEAQRFEEAAKFYYLFLIQHPDDVEARLGRGQALDKLPRKDLSNRKAVFDNFEYVLRLQPEQEDIRRREVDVALSIGERDVAMAHIETLLKGKYKNDGVLEQLLALCQAIGKDYSAAKENYESAIEHAPHHLVSYVQLANLYLTRDINKPKANEVTQRMLQKNGDKWEAHLAAAAILRYQGLPDDQEVAKALELAPNQPETILEAAATAQRRHRLDYARELLERGLKLVPKNPDARLAKDSEKQAEMYYRLARVEIDAGQAGKAEEWLRQGLQELPDSVQNALRHLLALVLIQRGDLVQAKEQIQTLRNRGAAEMYVDELNARVLMQEEKWGPATVLLEGLRLVVSQQPDLALQIEFLLGRCYEGLREFDRALASYERALTLKPDSLDALRARQGKASALVALGRPDEAIDEFQRVFDKDPRAALPLAKLLADRNLRLDPPNQDWKKIDDLVRAAPASPELELFKTQLAQAKNPKEALESLQKERDKDPSQPGPWIALIEAAEKGGDAAKMLALIDEAEKKLGDRVDLRLARARYWFRRGGDTVPTVLSKLEQNTGKFSADDRAALLGGLADLYIRLGDGQGAKRLWTELAQLQPKNLRVRMMLCELAYLTGTEAALGDFEPLLRQIHDIEGANGPQWRYAQACRIILAVRLQKVKPDQLAEARELLAKVMDERPTLGRAVLRQAELAGLDGSPETTVVKLYKQALSLGERDPAAFRPAILLLYQRGNLRDAENMLAKLQEQNSGLPDELRQLRILILGQLGQSQDALDLAEKPIKAGSKNPADHFWYAQALTQLGRKEDADKAYRMALSLPGIDKLPDIWVQYVLFLHQTGQDAKAEKIVHEAETKVPAEKAPFILAKCYEALREPARVEEQYLKLLQKNPTDPAALRNLVNFYDRNEQLAKAEPYLRRLLEPETKATDADRAMARRILAICLGSKGDWGQVQEGLDLLNQNATGRVASIPDQHALAKIYAKHTYYWLKAIKQFEDLQQEDGGRLALDEQLELARLYEHYGQEYRKKARDIYWKLLPQYADNPAIIYLCTRNLLREGESPDQLAGWLDRLEKVDGQSSMRALEIRVRLLKAQGKLEEAAKVLKEFAQRSGATEANMQTAAALLEEFRYLPEAEELYRKLVDKPGGAGNTLLLAAFLGRQGREADIREALDLCDKAWKTPPPNNVPPENVAFVALGILNGLKKANSQDYARVERGLSEALAKSPNSLALLFYMAGLHSLEQNYGEAEKAYRLILKQDPGNALAQNNLAWLLAARDGKAKADEALRLIQQALKSTGPSADLLDTEAFVYLKMDNPQDAVKDLQKALEEESRKQNPSAVMYFHLALAQEMLKNPEAARSLKQAQDLKLKVHPLEQPAFDQLRKALGPT